MSGLNQFRGANVEPGGGLGAAGTENLPDSRGWSAAHTAATSAPAAGYDHTFRSAASDITAFTGSTPKPTASIQHYSQRFD